MCCADPQNPSVRILLACGCGIQRCLPVGIKAGETFLLEPCPNCHAPFFGRYHDLETGVEQLTPKEFYEHS